MELNRDNIADQLIDILEWVALVLHEHEARVRQLRAVQRSVPALIYRTFHTHHDRP
jgi:hypothetical protein